MHTEIKLCLVFDTWPAFVNRNNCNMPFSNKDKTVIEDLYQFKEYSLQRILTEFSKTSCKKEGLGTSLKRFGKREAPTKGLRLHIETRAFN